MGTVRLAGSGWAAGLAACLGNGAFRAERLKLVMEGFGSVEIACGKGLGDSTRTRNRDVPNPKLLPS